MSGKSLSIKKYELEIYARTDNWNFVGEIPFPTFRVGEYIEWFDKSPDDFDDLRLTVGRIDHKFAYGGTVHITTIYAEDFTDPG